MENTDLSLKVYIEYLTDYVVNTFKRRLSLINVTEDQYKAVYKKCIDEYTQLFQNYLLNISIPNFYEDIDLSELVDISNYYEFINNNNLVQKYKDFINNSLIPNINIESIEIVGNKSTIEKYFNIPINNYKIYNSLQTSSVIGKGGCYYDIGITILDCTQHEDLNKLISEVEVDSDIVCIERNIEEKELEFRDQLKELEGKLFGKVINENISLSSYSSATTNDLNYNYNEKDSRLNYTLDDNVADVNQTKNSDSFDRKSIDISKSLDIKRNQIISNDNLEATLKEEEDSNSAITDEILNDTDDVINDTYLNNSSRNEIENKIDDISKDGNITIKYEVSDESYKEENNNERFNEEENKGKYNNNNELPYPEAVRNVHKFKSSIYDSEVIKNDETKLPRLFEYLSIPFWEKRKKLEIMIYEIRGQYRKLNKYSEIIIENHFQIIDRFLEKNYLASLVTKTIYSEMVNNIKKLIFHTPEIVLSYIREYSDEEVFRIISNKVINSEYLIDRYFDNEVLHEYERLLKIMEAVKNYLSSKTDRYIRYNVSLIYNKVNDAIERYTLKYLSDKIISEMIEDLRCILRQNYLELLILFDYPIEYTTSIKLYKLFLKKMFKFVINDDNRVKMNPQFVKLVENHYRSINIQNYNINWYIHKLNIMSEYINSTEILIDDMNDYTELNSILDILKNKTTVSYSSIQNNSLKYCKEFIKLSNIIENIEFNMNKLTESQQQEIERELEDSRSLLNDYSCCSKEEYDHKIEILLESIKPYSVHFPNIFLDQLNNKTLLLDFIKKMERETTNNPEIQKIIEIRKTFLINYPDLSNEEYGTVLNRLQAKIDNFLYYFECLVKLNFKVL